MSTTTVYYDMLEHYIVDINDDKICVEVKPWTNQSCVAKIFDIVFWFFPSLFMIGAAIFFICISRELNFYNIAFPIAALLFSALITVLFVNKIKCSNKYKTVINSQGLTYGNSKEKFFIPWEEVKSFGMVNKVYRTTLYMTPKYQTYSCIYISRSRFEEFSLRKKFQKHLSRFNELKSTEEFFLLAFTNSSDKTTEYEIYEKIRNFILQHVDRENEMSDIEI
ncbi:MAG: hypothetical protein E7612_04695 [Ruminococcaceae bacterium]|nr:hypothetical protein [Oscillospiraceae bacterium]